MTRKALFIEIHKTAERVTLEALDFSSIPSQLYPPEGGMTPEERLALQSLNLSPAAKSGLAKIIRHASITPVFDLLTLIDGVADPEIGDFKPWLGIRLSLNSVDDTDDTGNSHMMWHDELYDSYWAYKDYKQQKSG